MVVSYKECLKNHAATVGGHAVDGCGEFMPSRTASPSDPSSLTCAACGCHRNFHRRELDVCPSFPPLRSRSSSPSSPIPLPISHIPPPFHLSAHHMLLALSTGFAGAPPDDRRADFTPTFDVAKTENPMQKKRKRTKFSRDQKEKMYLFSEKMGWKMQKSDEKLVQEFCNEIGIGKRVLKVWMHNNKYVAGKGDRGRASQCCNNGGKVSNQSA